MAWYDFGGTAGNSSTLSKEHAAQAGATAAVQDAIAQALKLSQTGATEADFANIFAPLKEQMGLLDSSMGRLSGLNRELVSGALAQTGGAGMAATNAARLSGSGRFGRGGNAALMAARGAASAASGQSAALSSALVQGTLASANYDAGLLQQRAGIAGLMSQYQQGISGLKEERARLPMDLQLELANVLMAQAGQHAGLAQTRVAGRSQENAAFISGLFGAASSVVD